MRPKPFAPEVLTESASAGAASVAHKNTAAIPRSLCRAPGEAIVHLPACVEGEAGVAVGATAAVAVVCAVRCGVGSTCAGACFAAMLAGGAGIVAAVCCGT